MKAFILAGGLGTRLQGRFGELPKSLVPIGGRPFLLRQLGWLADSGVHEAVLCVGHGAGRMRETLGAHAAGVALAYSEEPAPLGTAGALALARAHAAPCALVLNGDTLAPCDPWGLERERWERGAIGALALFEVPDARARGRVECDDAGRVTRFVEKDATWRGPAWVHGGVAAFSGALWRELPAGPGSLERDVLPRLAAEGRLVGVRCPGGFWDIGTPEDWERADRELGGGTSGEGA